MHDRKRWWTEVSVVEFFTILLHSVRTASKLHIARPSSHCARSPFQTPQVPQGKLTQNKMTSHYCLIALNHVLRSAKVTCHHPTCAAAAAPRVRRHDTSSSPVLVESRAWSTCACARAARWIARLSAPTTCLPCSAARMWGRPDATAPEAYAGLAQTCHQTKTHNTHEQRNIKFLNVKR